MKRNVLSLTLLTLFIAALPASAQYAGIPGDIPPIPDSYQLDVVTTYPCSSAFGIPSVPGMTGIPNITYKEAYRIENHDEDEIIYRRNGITVACLEYREQSYDLAYVFTGEWGLNYEVFDNVVSISQLSPSGRYYAVGGDGTGASRGPVYVIDLETGVKYCTTSSIWYSSDWIEGDYLLIESSGRSDSIRDMLMHGDIGNIPWINDSYMTEREGSSNNFVLYHGGSSWMILPEDRFYNYSSRGIPVSYENGIIFDVAASPNVIPSLAGIDSAGSSFGEWIDSAGGYDAAFPVFDFRVYVDTRTNSVSDIRQMTPGMVVEGFLNAVKGGSYAGILNYLTELHRGAIHYEQREETMNILPYFSGLEYRICEISEDGDRADVACELTLLGYRAANRFTLINDNGRWRIDDWKFDDESSVISGNSTAGWFSPLIETILKTFASMISGREI